MRKYAIFTISDPVLALSDEFKFRFVSKLFFLTHPGNDQLVRRRCTVENQFDLSRRTI